MNRVSIELHQSYTGVGAELEQSWNLFCSRQLYYSLDFDKV